MNSDYKFTFVYLSKVVCAINATSVDVDFASALSEAVEGATVEVKDDNGVVVPVNAQDIAKGATGAQFTFKSEYKSDLEGVWTVNGVAFSFTAIKQFEDITAAVVDDNEVALLAALKAAGIQNINEDLITDYFDAIDNATTTPENLADIQELIDEANEDAAEGLSDAAVVKVVADAKTQPQLLTALEANFERVNADWIVDYAAETVTTTGTPTLLALDSTNYVGETNATTVNAIQVAIDAVNTAAIGTADTNAGTAADQAKVTALIEKWVVADDAKTPTVTPKADDIKASKIKEAAFKVAEAKTPNALYNALVAYANITPDATLKATELNANLKQGYLTELDASGIRANLVAEIKLGTATVKADIVTAADGTALTAALATIDGLTVANTAAEVKAALQKLADVTAHNATATKFDMSKVLEDKLLDYVTLATHGFDAQTIDTLGEVNTAITNVNGSVEEAAALKVIASADTTTAQVRDALTQIALSNTANTTTTAYINASSQVKLEIAEFVVKNRTSLATTLTAAVVIADGSTSYAANVIGKASADHTAKIGGFNAIGNLASTTPAAIKAALDTYAYAPYVALTSVQKLAVAEEISKLTKSDGATPPVITPLNFSGADAVKTVKAANDFIDAAIAK